ncbi:MAG: DUF222 domain-containing protein [Candidatus Dormibacteraceae bacterium]
MPNAHSQELANQLCELSAHLHSGLAELTQLIAIFDTQQEWAVDGIRSCAHWLSINTGYDLFSAAELLRVGHALENLSALAEAFSSGQLSLDKVRAITKVATPADQNIWIELATQVSASQLIRICRGYRQAMEADNPDRAERQLAQRGLWAHYTDEGMLHLVAKLPPEDGALLLAAIEAVTGNHPLPEDDPSGVADPAEDRWAAKRADALVSICENVGARLASPDKELTTSQPQLVVHVDAGVLSGEQPDGRCQLEGGIPLAAELARRLGCDAELVAVTEREGIPIDVGRSRRLVSGRLRLALQSRDSGCRFPGCGVAVKRTHAHHIEHWAKGGRTDLANLVSLCGFHHRRLHDGAYRIRQEGELHFETSDGRLIQPPSPISVDSLTGGSNHLRQLHRELEINGETPVALEGGAPCDYEHVVWVMANSRAGPLNL